MKIGCYGIRLNSVLGTFNYSPQPLNLEQILDPPLGKQMWTTICFGFLLNIIRVWFITTSYDLDLNLFMSEIVFITDFYRT